jgi:hypothetical protein
MAGMHDGMAAAAMALRAICDPRPFYTIYICIGNVRNVVLCNVTTGKRSAPVGNTLSYYRTVLPSRRVGVLHMAYRYRTVLPWF